MGLGTGTTEPDIDCMAFMGYERFGATKYVRCGAFGILPLESCNRCTEFRKITVPDYYR
ncbi:MAG TPA: hypothetical protein VEB88_01370 [Candidatus Acidoferrales bacterium]|jgi:hypothetical protein|nr:hypothetical protein [Candidatus Acidoferrales bacterium]